VTFGAVVVLLTFVSASLLRPPSGHLPTPHLCPTSTRVELAGPGVELHSLDEGWLRGAQVHYAWRAVVQLPVKNGGQPWAELTIVRRSGKRHPRGDEPGTFRLTSGPTPDQPRADIPDGSPKRLREREFQLEAPLDSLPRGAGPGSFFRARARLVAGVGEETWLVAECPFTYKPHLAPTSMVQVTATRDLTPEGADDQEDEATVSCQVCGDPVTGHVHRCERCGTPHHDDCWRYIGHCSTFGCR
jgi:hypothetical protein